MKRLLCFFLVITALHIISPVAAQVCIEKLLTEYTPTPLGIDVEQPGFSWLMVAPEGERGYLQNSFRVVVKDPSGNIVWDTKKVEDGNSVGIKYAGTPLKPSTRYTWDVTVWDQKGKSYTSSSWFETGLMNTGMSAWGGAEWIGGSNDDLVLFSPYLIIYNVKYKAAIEPGSTKASFVYGANDSRLMDKNKNIWQLEKKRNESYIKVELDISGVDGTESGMAKINVYRAGYKDTDTPETPFKTFEVLTQFINNDNKYSEHLIQFSSVFGQISLMLDGSASFIKTAPPVATQTTQQGPPEFGGRQTGASVNLNPMGNGGNYIPFGMLCDIGFSAAAGQKASFSEIVVSNNRLPKNVLFQEDLSELSADYSTSNEKVNKLWSNRVWSNIDNFLSIPTDCPQRNERMGWSGDINVFSRTTTYVSNADQFFRRHMFAMRDVQHASGKFTDIAPVGGGFGGVLWGSAGIVVPWETYLQYGDKGILEENYPAMVKYMDYLETTIDPKTGISTDGQLGDWLGPQNNQLGSGYLVAAYHAYDLDIMARVAGLLG